MLREAWEQVLVPLFFVAGEVSLWVAFASSAPPYDYSLRWETSLPVRNVLLAASLIFLYFFTARFLAKFRARPTPVRRVVLLSLAFFAAGFTSYGVTSLVRFQDKLLRRFAFDLNIFLLMLGVLFLLVFGIDVLLRPNQDGRSRLAKGALAGLAVVTYAVYLASMLEKVPAHLAEDTALSSVAEGIRNAFAVVGAGILVVMASRSWQLARRVEQSHYRRALYSLGVADLLILAAIASSLAEEALGDLDYVLKIVAIVLADLAFYFLYEGFVKPRSQASGTGDARA